MVKFMAQVKEAKVSIKKEKIEGENIEYPITTVTLVISSANNEIQKYVGSDHWVEIGEK